jgi:CBS domain-containing membrane protein
MKKIGELKVSDYMHEQAIIVDDTEKLSHAIGLMEHHRLSVLPVTDNQGQIVGILTNTDLIEITHDLQSDISALNYVTDTTREYLIKMIMDQGDTTFVRDVMTSPVDTVTPNMNLVVAARKLVDKHYHHLPVVDEAGKPIAILSTSDFVRAIADHGALVAG